MLDTKPIVPAFRNREQTVFGGVDGSKIKGGVHMPFTTFENLPGLLSGSRASVARTTDKNGNRATVGVDVIRRNYDAVTLQSLGVLLEGRAAPNLIRNSGTLDFITSSGNNVSSTQWRGRGATAEVSTDPAHEAKFGVGKVFKVTELLTTDAHTLQSPIADAPATNRYRITAVKLKAGTADKLSLHLKNQFMSNNDFHVKIDLSTGTILSSPNYTADQRAIKPIGDGWYLVWLMDLMTTGTGFRNCTTGFLNPANNATDSFLGTGRTYFVAEPQQSDFEGVLPSYIESGTSPVTRAGDVLLLPSLNSIGVTQQTLANGYTLVATVQFPSINPTGTHRVLELNNSGSTDNIVHMSLINGQFAAGVTTAGVSQFAVAGGTPDVDTTYKIGLSVGPTGAILCVNGIQIGSTGSAMVMPTPSRAVFANGEGSNLEAMLNLANLDVYVRPLTLAQLQSATQ